MLAAARRRANLGPCRCRPPPASPSPRGRFRASAALPGLRRDRSDAHSFCLDCWQGLTFLGEPCCARCGLPFDYGGEERASNAGAASPIRRLRPAAGRGRLWRCGAAGRAQAQDMAAGRASPRPSPVSWPAMSARAERGALLVPVPLTAGGSGEARLQPVGADRLGAGQEEPGSSRARPAAPRPARLRRSRASAGASARSRCAAPSRCATKPGRRSPAARSSWSTTSSPAAPPPRLRAGAEAGRRGAGRGAVLGPGGARGAWLKLSLRQPVSRDGGSAGSESARRRHFPRTAACRPRPGRAHRGLRAALSHLLR